MLVGYIVCKDREEAERVSAALLKKKLASCTNHFPVQSRYVWKGKLKKQEEYVLLAKTVVKKRKQIIAMVSHMHSYEIPCIAFITFDANK